MVERPNTALIGQDKKTLTFKVLLYLTVQARPGPWLPSSMWISSGTGISKIEIMLFTSVVANAAGAYLRMKDIMRLCANFLWCTFTMDRKCLVSIGNNNSVANGVMYFSILICLRLDLVVLCFFLCPGCHVFQTRQSPMSPVLLRLVARSDREFSRGKTVGNS